jgi:hypothetical protein
MGCASDTATHWGQGVLGGVATLGSLAAFGLIEEPPGLGLGVGTLLGGPGGGLLNSAISGTGAGDALDNEKNVCNNINNTQDSIAFFNGLTDADDKCIEENIKMKTELENLNDALLAGKNDLGKRKKNFYMKLSIFAIQMLVTIMFAYYFMSTHKVNVG